MRNVNSGELRNFMEYKRIGVTGGGIQIEPIRLSFFENSEKSLQKTLSFRQ